MVGDGEGTFAATLCLYSDFVSLDAHYDAFYLFFSPVFSVFLLDLDFEGRTGHGVKFSLYLHTHLKVSQSAREVVVEFDPRALADNQGQPTAAICVLLARDAFRSSPCRLKKPRIRAAA